MTGAGRGIGRAVALQLAEGGARVVLVARSSDQLNETAEADQRFRRSRPAPFRPTSSDMEEIVRTVVQTNDIFRWGRHPH